MRAALPLERYDDNKVLSLLKSNQAFPSYPQYAKALEEFKECKVQLYKPLIFEGDTRVYKDTEIVAILGDYTQFATKQVYSIDNYYNFLRARYQTSSVRFGWVNIHENYQVDRYLTKPLYELRHDLYYTTSIFKLAGLGRALYQKTIILYSSQKPHQSWMRFLYEVVGNLTVIHVRPMKSFEKREVGKIYYELPSVSAVVEKTNKSTLVNDLAQSQGIVSSIHMVYGLQPKSSDKDVRVVVDTYEYEIEYEIDLHEPQVTEHNKYTLCDQDINISDRKLDILMEFHKILMDDDWEDILDVRQDENNEITFIINKDKVFLKDSYVTDRDKQEFLEKLQELYSDLIIQ